MGLALNSKEFDITSGRDLWLEDVGFKGLGLEVQGLGVGCLNPKPHGIASVVLGKGAKGLCVASGLEFEEGWASPRYNNITYMV